MLLTARRFVVSSLFVFLAGVIAPTPPAHAAEPKLVFAFDAADHEGPRDVYPPHDYLAISEDGTMLAAASRLGGLAIWNLPQVKPARILEPLRPFGGNQELQWDLAFLPGEPKKLAAARMLSRVKRAAPFHTFALKLQIWDTASGKKLNEWTAPNPDPPQALKIGFVHRPEVAVSEDGAVAAASWSTSPWVYDFMRAKLAPFGGPLQLPLPGSPVTVVSWELATNRVRDRVKLEWGYAPIALTRSGNKLATWDGSERTVVIRDGATKSIQADGREREWGGGIFKIAYSLDRRRLFMLSLIGKFDQATGSFSSDENDRLQLTEWNLADGEFVDESEPLSTFNRIAAMNDDATRYAAAVDKATVKVFDAATNKESAVLKLDGLADDDVLQRLTFDRRGRYLTASTDLGGIRVWDLGTPEPAPAAK